jgi:hypothetical protein
MYSEPVMMNAAPAVQGEGVIMETAPVQSAPVDTVPAQGIIEEAPTEASPIVDPNAFIIRGGKING